VTDDGKPPIISGSGKDAVSHAHNEEIIFFGKPEDNMLGRATNRPEVSEEFITYGVAGASSGAQPVVGSFEAGIPTENSFDEEIIFMDQDANQAPKAMLEPKSNEELIFVDNDIALKM